MIRHKVCMLGAFAVGKTSLVRRYVHSIFDAKYQTTIGVQIEKRTIEATEREIDLMIWDIAGEDEFFRVPESFLKGAAGCLLVVDCTRRGTVETASELRERTTSVVGDVPMIALINKSDLCDERDLPADVRVTGLEAEDHLTTSALNGVGVAEAFELLAQRIEATHGRVL